MNLGLYRSWHAMGAGVVVLSLTGWHLAAPRPFGDRDDPNVAFLLATGWIAVACYLVLALYAARRAAHRLRLSPEFAWRAPLPAIERAQSELLELQNRAMRRELAGRKDLRSEARAILRRHGVHRVLAVAVHPAPGDGTWRVEAGPRQPLGRLASWLHVHVFYGIAAALIVWFHGGARTGSTMGLLLNALSAVVIGSGLLGALLWTFGPTWLTRAERELSIEKAYALRAHFDRHIGALASAGTAAETADQAQLERDLATLRGQRQRVAREAARLERYRTLLRGWRIVHVPCSVALLALVAVHVVTIYFY